MKPWKLTADTAGSAKPLIVSRCVFIDGKMCTTLHPDHRKNWNIRNDVTKIGGHTVICSKLHEIFKGEFVRISGRKYSGVAVRRIYQCSLWSKNRRGKVSDDSMRLKDI